LVPAQNGPEAAGEYRLASDKAAPSSALVFLCPRCRAHMTAAEDQVGRQLACPDCGTLVHVPPRPPRIRAPAADAYAIDEATDSPSPPPAAPRYIAVHCPLCRTLMQVPEDQAGTTVVCHDCGTKTLVPPPLKPRPLSPPPPPYALRAETASTPADFVPPPSILMRGTLDPGETLAERPPHGPRWPLLTGVITFPFYTEVWLRWVCLSCWALAAGHLAYFAVQYGVGVGAGGLGDLTPMAFSMIATVLAVILGVAWLALAIIICLTILLDTAAGNDRVVNWPEAGMFVDWIAETLLVVNGLLVSGAAGSGIAWLLRRAELPDDFAVPATILLLLPILLLSMLERNSALGLFSAAVWRSLILHPWSLLVFYLASAAVTALVLGGVLAVLDQYGIRAAISAAAPLASAGVMIYARLLGRLAWCCSQSPPSDREPPAEDEEDAEDHDDPA
jgi:DNA-directed RNA polymerase subunit RPC12/RpoP